MQRGDDPAAAGPADDEAVLVLSSEDDDDPTAADGGVIFVPSSSSDDDDEGTERGAPADSDLVPAGHYWCRLAGDAAALDAALTAAASQPPGRLDAPWCEALNACTHCVATYHGARRDGGEHLPPAVRAALAAADGPRLEAALAGGPNETIALAEVLAFPDANLAADAGVEAAAVGLVGALARGARLPLEAGGFYPGLFHLVGAADVAVRQAASTFLSRARIDSAEAAATVAGTLQRAVGCLAGAPPPPPLAPGRPPPPFPPRRLAWQVVLKVLDSVVVAAGDEDEDGDDGDGDRPTAAAVLLPATAGLVDAALGEVRAGLATAWRAVDAVALMFRKLGRAAWPDGASAAAAATRLVSALTAGAACAPPPLQASIMKALPAIAQSAAAAPGGAALVRRVGEFLAGVAAGAGPHEFGRAAAAAAAAAALDLAEHCDWRSVAECAGPLIARLAGGTRADDGGDDPLPGLAARLAARLVEADAAALADSVAAASPPSPFAWAPWTPGAGEAGRGDGGLAAATDVPCPPPRPAGSWAVAPMLWAALAAAPGGGAGAALVAAAARLADAEPRPPPLTPAGPATAAATTPALNGGGGFFADPLPGVAAAPVGAAAQPGPAQPHHLPALALPGPATDAALVDGLRGAAAAWLSAASPAALVVAGGPGPLAALAAGVDARLRDAAVAALERLAAAAGGGGGGGGGGGDARCRGDAAARASTALADLLLSAPTVDGAAPVLTLVSGAAAVPRKDALLSDPAGGRRFRLATAVVVEVARRAADARRGRPPLPPAVAVAADAAWALVRAALRRKPPKAGTGAAAGPPPPPAAPPSVAALVGLAWPVAWLRSAPGGVAPGAAAKLADLVLGWGRDASGDEAARAWVGGMAAALTAAAGGRVGPGGVPAPAPPVQPASLPPDLLRAVQAALGPGSPVPPAARTALAPLLGDAAPGNLASAAHNPLAGLPSRGGRALPPATRPVADADAPPRPARARRAGGGAAAAPAPPPPPPPPKDVDDLFHLERLARAEAAAEAAAARRGGGGLRRLTGAMARAAAQEAAADAAAAELRDREERTGGLDFPDEADGGGRGRDRGGLNPLGRPQPPPPPRRPVPPRPPPPPPPPRPSGGTTRTLPGPVHGRHARPHVRPVHAPRAPARAPPPLLFEMAHVERDVLAWNLASVASGEATAAGLRALARCGGVPSTFRDAAHYGAAWRPLLVEEVRASLLAALEEARAGWARQRGGGGGGNESGGPGAGKCPGRCHLVVDGCGRVDQLHKLTLSLPGARAGASWRAAGVPCAGDLAWLAPASAGDGSGGAGAPTFDFNPLAPHLLGLVRWVKEDGVPRTTRVEVAVNFMGPAADAADHARLTAAHAAAVPGRLWQVASLMPWPTFERQFKALAAVPRLPRRLRVELLTGAREGDEGGDRAAGRAAAAAGGGQPPPPRPLSQCRLLPPGLRTALYESLNASQSDAVSDALGPPPGRGRFVLVKGPPGTGKTAAVVAIVSALLAATGPPGGGGSGSAHPGASAAGTSQALSPPASPPWSGGCGPSSASQQGAAQVASQGGRLPGAPPPRRVLVCAQSNAAVDEVVARLVGARDEGAWARDGRRVPLAGLVRVGAGAGPGLEAWSLDAAAEGLVGEAVRRDGAPPGVRRRALRAARVTALAAAPVVAATLSAAGGELADLVATSAACARAHAAAPDRPPPIPLFDAVVIDEAAAAVEAAALVPLTLLAPHAPVVLVGDPAQLPATVLARGAAVRTLLGRSLFERLADAGVPARMLDTQYRMHPAISAFPAAHFYGGALRDAGDGWWAAAEDGGDARPRLAFFDVARGSEAAPDAGGSLANWREADAAVALAVRLADVTGDAPLLPRRGAASVAVITPYNAQAALLRENVRRARLPPGALPISVYTVDGVQGREFDGVVFSCVRACRAPSPAGGGGEGGPAAAVASSLGFLADVRRANVALTRAKRRLFVVGRASTLEGCPPYRALMEAARAGGGFQADVQDVRASLARVMGERGGGGGGGKRREGERDVRAPRNSRRQRRG